MQLSEVVNFVTQYWWILLLAFIFLWILGRGKEPRFRGSFSIATDIEISKLLVILGILIIVVLGSLYITSPVRGQIVVGLWNDKNGNNVVDPGEISEQSLDLNPYSMLPAQALYKDSGAKFLYIYGNVSYTVSQSVSEPFYGIYGILAYDGVASYRWVTPSFVTVNNIPAKNLATGATETLNNAYFAEGLRFSSASATTTTVQSGAVFPYNAKFSGSWKSRVLVLSKNVAEEIYHSNYGTQSLKTHTLENWMENLGLRPSSGYKDYQLLFYFAYAKESGTGDKQLNSQDEFVALPVKSPVSFWVRMYSTETYGTSMNIVKFDVSYVTQSVVYTQSTADQLAVILVNPYLIAAVLLIIAGFALSRTKRRRRR